MYKYTPLHIAVKSGDLDLVKMILNKGADLNAKSVSLKEGVNSLLEY